MRTGLVYALCDRLGEPYYVGRTTRTAGVRLGEHRRESTTRGRTSDCHLRTLELIEAGRGPAIWVLEDAIPIAKVMRREQHWISYAEGAGWRLLNYRGGGDGKLVWDAADRARQSRRAARQPRDLHARFLPLGAPDSSPISGSGSEPEYIF